MTWITILAIAVGLAMDAFAVSIAHGVVIQKNHLKNALIFGLSFGLFQMIMPLAGWALGSGVADIVTHVDHWIAFAILVLLGAKMIYEAFHFSERERCFYRVSVRMVLCLSLATSLDAFAVGLSFAFLNVNIFWPIAAIGAVTFLLSFSGIFLGARCGHVFENKMEIAAGIVLIMIGLRILIAHV